MILEYRIDDTKVGTFHRYMWQQPSGVVYNFKFKEAKQDSELAQFADKLEEDTKYDNEPVIFKDNSRILEIRKLIDILDERPNLTATQYNNYLQTLDWDQAIELRSLVSNLAKLIVERKDLDGTITTEAQAFNLVKTFITSTPKRKLARLLLNQSDF